MSYYTIVDLASQLGVCPAVFASSHFPIM